MNMETGVIRFMRTMARYVRGCVVTDDCHADERGAGAASAPSGSATELVHACELKIILAV